MYAPFFYDSATWLRLRHVRAENSLPRTYSRIHSRILCPTEKLTAFREKAYSWHPKQT